MVKHVQHTVSSGGKLLSKMKNTQGKKASDQAWGVFGSAPHSLVLCNLGASNVKGTNHGTDKREIIPSIKKEESK